jgi:hypothetical protein
MNLSYRNLTEVMKEEKDGRTFLYTWLHTHIHNDVIHIGGNQPYCNRFSSVPDFSKPFNTNVN